MSKTISGIIAACVCLNALYKVSTAQAVPWEEVKLGGDFRYRHEYLKNEGEDERHRHRIRGRIKMSTKVNDQTDVILRLATGGIGTSSATSTNQTLDDGF